ncbi:aspartate aminotransferase family protein [Wohlfahrtiimonas chitiniclastica]|uniref:aspartate aminotransferase family protein n=1 Tax=Wohlfahrtiimonas chitiniclastica TaxID=400946 RepID=UPI001BCD5354|nr:aspartate aminotransferase family protein [Wohlfahrtiimonas chitiniclastica]MBS7816818.1 aspartate aminotransferase family protein [Wohlfahrtiimonas chitiniclastica]MBS7822289.1 aspartate aminotransferase family protein [Wohlfahrtiimonas chitiniclastica]MBS7830351.1 aspartate aminotransferase family protein [Wohlfahrtiimonas chitiniclastica]MBS7832319.1 aspartate aminotransferase family protein [Wohlfahrtiimonas chitiniclastica]
MLMNAYQRFPVTFVRGKGPFLYSDQNVEYIDCVSGIAVNCLGHAHPVMVAAAKEQSEKLFHISNLYHNDAQTALAQKLIRNSFHQQVFFCNSGTEANELAVKIARKYGHKTASTKSKILYMKDSFHGRSTGALAITGQQKYQEPFRPLMGDVVECEFNNVEMAKALVNNDFCGIFIEPVQGESGIRAATPEFLQTLRDLADQHDALLVFDEIQCGMGRMGTLFAYQQLDVVPDVVTLAKALGGGVPIAACLTKDKANDVIVPGDHGSTYGGNPFVCAIANAVLTELVDHGVVAAVKERGSYTQKKLNLLRVRYPFIQEIRGTGLLLGIKFDESVVKSSDVVKAAFENRLLLVGAGDNVVRFFPPLNVTLDHIDVMVSRLEQVLETLVPQA